ncbi:MAG TPA: hypothetical protein ENK19_09625 [Acidobacteria bacterium]|nr:hypothetical protein [Acidobacteriota bacterium]
MKLEKRITGFAAVLTLALVILLGTVALLQANTGSTADGKKPCCFENDRYSGVCKVYPDDDETCADILAYLNNPMATGKTYCGNTHIRGGWRQADCK